jgi:hypothetical protein
MINLYNNLLILDESEQEILTLAEVKDFMKVTCAKDDEQIQDMTKEAICFAEKFCGISLADKSYLVSYMRCSINNNYIKLPIRFIESITKVLILDKFSDQSVELDKQYYNFDLDLQIFFLLRNLDFDLIKIYFKSGLSVIKVSDLRFALLIHINILYKKRLPSTKNNEVNFYSEVEKLYLPYRLLRL